MNFNDRQGGGDRFSGIREVWIPSCEFGQPCAAKAHVLSLERAQEEVKDRVRSPDFKRFGWVGGWEGRGGLPWPHVASNSRAA